MVLEKSDKSYDNGYSQKQYYSQTKTDSQYYRYGFQGQEMDDEIKGEGNSVNYKYRMHDPRVGRFFANDPLMSKYPYLTPYQFSSNSPIYLIELEGLEGTLSSFRVWYDEDGRQNKVISVKVVDGLQKDVIKSVVMPYKDPNGKIHHLEYALRNEDGSRGIITEYSVENKPNVKELNKAFESFESNIRPTPKEKTFQQKFNESAPSWAKDRALEGGADPAINGEYAGAEGKGRAADDLDGIADKMKYLPNPFVQGGATGLKTGALVLHTISDFETMDSKDATYNLGVRLTFQKINSKVKGEIKGAGLSKAEEYVAGQAVRKVSGKVKKEALTDGDND